MIRQIAALLAGLALVALFARAPASVRDASGKPLLPNATLVKHVAKAQLPLVVTIYWLRVINLGSTARTPDDGRDVLAMSELIETLDPDFSQVYWFAALNAVMPSTTEVGKWANAADAADHLRRGLARFPDEVRMTIVLAYNLWRQQNKLVEAADVLRAAAKYPTAPRWLPSLATRLLVAAGDFEASKQLAREFLENAADEQTRRKYLEREKAIELEKTLVAVESAAARFLAERGRPALSADELFRGGYLTEQPHDPFGGEIRLTPDGKAFSTAHEERLVIYMGHDPQ